MLRQRGDTIVEVIMAFAIFALLAMGSIIIMNQSMAIAQRSLEQTQVRQIINGQADILRTAHNDSSVWAQIKAKAVTNSDITTSAQLVAGCPTVATIPKNGFIVGKNTTGTSLQYLPLSSSNFTPAPVTSTIDYTAAAPKVYGLWVQAVQVSGSPVAYDMYIRACWDTTGSTVPATLATIVRLYDAS